MTCSDQFEKMGFIERLQLYDTIDNGQGLWSIIPESKRRKIKRHIEKY